jgi:hypothetical protein
MIIHGDEAPDALTITVFWSAPHWRVIFHVPRSPTDPTQGYKLAYQPMSDASPIGALPLAAIASAIALLCGGGLIDQETIWGLATVA